MFKLMEFVTPTDHPIDLGAVEFRRLRPTESNFHGVDPLEVVD